MSNTAQDPVPQAKAGFRNLPAIVYFEGDDPAKVAIAGLQHYLRLSFTEFAKGRDSETILITSQERTIVDKAQLLRAPNVRVIALSDWKFRDPRTDGVVYAYLPVKTPPALVERTIDNALDHIHLLNTRREINERLAGATKEIRDLNAIGAALSAEHDTEKLLQMILSKSREITRADAGSLYLVEEQEQLPPGGVVDAEERNAEIAGAMIAKPRRKSIRKMLRFTLAQNDSVAGSFQEAVMEINSESVAGYVALTGNAVNLEDAYRCPEGVPYQINRKFDEESGYRTKSVLAVPMRNHKGETVGVVQLLNAKRTPGAKLDSVKVVTAEVVPFSARQQEVLTSLSSQAAVALENSRLYQAIQKMLEGFVKASVTAIEARDPTTSGHSFRVANLTLALAEAVDRADNGIYRDVKFTRAQMREIRYASLLHDFGKVGVREEVLVKAKKLYPFQLDLIFRRFQFAKRTAETEMLKRKLAIILDKGKEAYAEQLTKLQAEFEAEITRLEEDFGFITASNEPSLLEDSSLATLDQIAKRVVADVDGSPLSLLDLVELRLLSIRKGSLDDSERRKIESHVLHTYNFLTQIPWTTELGSVPEIARGHHEKLTGDGYPFKLSAPEIPLQTRMMTIADIFDALAAGDRPYKSAVPTEQALRILEESVNDGQLDPHLYRLFIDANIHSKWKVEPFPY